MDERMIILGLDGATWDIIDPMISREELPNFKLLKERGIYGEVSTSYLGSPVIWTAIFTGKTKDKFGDPFFGINRARLQAKRLWEIAAENGLRIGVLHTLLTWPPAEVDGFVIPDIFAMGPETYPQEYRYFQKLYLSRHSKNLIEQGYYFLRSFLSCGSLDVVGAFLKLLSSGLLCPQALNIFRHRLMVVTKLDHNFFLKLIRRYRPQVNTFHLHALDTVSHKYWQFIHKPGRYGGVIEDFYREADRLLGRVFRQMGDHTTLVVVADHGFREFVDGRGKFELNTAGLRDLVHIDTAARVVRIGNAFVMNLGSGLAEADALRIADEMASAELQDGTSLFVNVNKIEQNIHFRLNKRILESKNPMEQTVSFKAAGAVPFGDLFRKKVFVDTGIHAAGKGIFAACGPKFLENINLNKVEIYDITPTLLTLLHLPIGEDMDGNFDDRWFHPDALKELKPRYIPTHEQQPAAGGNVLRETYTAEEVSNLEERLKMLGYL